MSRALVLCSARYTPEIARGVNIELLLRVCVMGLGTWSFTGQEEKLAFDAVSGVLGVFCVVFRSGGLSGGRGPRTRESLSRMASIFVVIGASIGNKLSGGSFNGWRFFLLALAPDLCRVSDWASFPRSRE